jgi:hypothetical protein
MYNSFGNAIFPINNTNILSVKQKLHDFNTFKVILMFAQ